MDIGKDALSDDLDDLDDLDGMDGIDEKHSMRETVEAAPDKVLRLTINDFSWKKVAGLYIRDSKFG